MAINKVEYKNRVLIDLRPTTAIASDVALGKKFFLASGEQATGTNSGGGGTISLQSKNIIPSETAQTITADNGYDGLSQVSVGAISSTYVGSGIARNDSSDLTASGAIVSVPAGYYAESASASVANSTVGTPTVSKGTVSNHTIIVTPSVTNTSGYITGGTINGTGVSVSASELASGNKAISQNGTDIDVVGYSTVSVDVNPTLQAKTNITPTTSSQTITPDSGYDGLSSVQINGMPSGTTGTPSATKGTVSNHSVSVTPSVTNTTGYITGGTKTGTAVTVSASELVSGALSISSNGTGIDVTNYATVNVALEFSTITVSSSNPTGGNNGDIWIKTVS